MTSKNDINNALIHDQLFFADISELLRSGRETAYRSVNSVMIKTYWQIGKRIVEQEQHGKARANYGEQLIVHLSRYLTDCFGKGFSVANLKNIRQFYQTFTVLDELATQCVANIRKVDPHLSEQELEEMLRYLKYKRQEDPLSLLQDDAIGACGGQLLFYKMLPNFEIALFLAQITGAFLLTDNHSRWAEINSAQNLDGLACGAYNEIASIINDKKYILNLDSETAFSLRKSVHTRQFRKSMRSIYDTICHEKPSEIKINERQKQELDKAHIAISKEILKYRGNLVSARFNSLIPQSGIVHNNVLRLLFLSGIEKYVKHLI